jgi:hypothetical protein
MSSGQKLTGFPVHACLEIGLRVVAHADYGAKFVMASEMGLIVLLMALCLIFRNSLAWDLLVNRNAAPLPLPLTVAWLEQLEPFDRSTLWPDICLNVYSKCLYFSC